MAQVPVLTPCRTGNTRRRVAAWPVRSNPLLLSLLVVVSAVEEVTGWKDQGHMLVGAMARELTKPRTIAKIEGVLKLWDHYYPSTSTLETATVWLDHVACQRPGDHCDFARQDALQLFKVCHYCSVTWNPQEVPMRMIDQVLPFPIGGADWALHLTYSALKLCSGDRLVPPSPLLEQRSGSPASKRRRAPPKKKTYVSLLTFRASTKASVGRKKKKRRRGGKGKAPAEGEAEAEDEYEGAPVPADVGGATALPAEIPEHVHAAGAAGEEENLPPLMAATEGEDLPFAETAHPSVSDVEPSLAVAATGVCSALSYNLYVRMLIHVYADIHQPLHASEVFSKVFPRGDAGGNLVHVTLPESGKGSKTSLHGEWDSGFGLYTTPYSRVDMAELRDEAKRLLRQHAANDTALQLYADFPAIINESHSIVRNFVYSEFDWATFSYDFLPYKPSKKYITRARQIAQERLALAGRRLALLLESISRFLPSEPEKSLVPEPLWTSSFIWSPIAQRMQKELPQEGSQLAGNSELTEISTPEKRLTDSADSAAPYNIDEGIDGSGVFWGRRPRHSKGNGERFGRHFEKQEGGMVPVMLASPGLLTVATSVVLLLLLILSAALYSTWKQVRLYKRAFQVVIQRSAFAPQLCGLAAAPAEAGDWSTAAASVAEYDAHEQQRKDPPDSPGEKTSEKSTVLDRVPEFSGTSTNRLLT